MTAIVIAVLTAALTTTATVLINRASEAANRRRDRYAEAVTTLVAWIEYPYRVRRRTDDKPETLAALVERGHDLQERLACHHAWITTEDADTATVYQAARAAIGQLVGPAIREAWDSTPAATAADMNLGDWGPAPACATHVADVEAAVAKRFGWKRVKAALGA
jgi:hypothetical protein